jgi:hypothetical protein
MGEPRDKKLYNKVKRLADKKFESRSGIYRSSWIVAEYKRRGGKYIGSKPRMSGLKRWYKEDWVDLNRPIKNSSGKTIGYMPCGRQSASKRTGKYPLCRPSKRVNRGTPRTYKEISKKSLSLAKKQKQKKRHNSNVKFGGCDLCDLQTGGRYGENSTSSDEYDFFSDAYDFFSEQNAGSPEAAVSKSEILDCFKFLYGQGLYSRSLDEFKIMYKKWILKNHPDKNPDKPELVEVVKKVNNCYKIATGNFKIFSEKLWMAPQQPQAQPQPQTQPQTQPQPQWRPQPQPASGWTLKPQKWEHEEPVTTGIRSRPVKLARGDVPFYYKSRGGGDFDMNELISGISNMTLAQDGGKAQYYGGGKAQYYGGGKAQYYGRRSKVMVKVPSNVKKWALYAFKLKKLGFRGARETGWKRAKQLATKDYIPIEDFRYMRNWYARHRYTSYPGFKEWVNASRSKDSKWHNRHAIIAWVTWGGNAGFRWVNSDRAIQKLNKHFGKNYKKIKALF